MRSSRKANRHQEARGHVLGDQVVAEVPARVVDADRRDSERAVLAGVDELELGDSEARLPLDEVAE